MKTKKLSIVIFALVAASLLASCKKNNGTDAPKQGFAASTEQGGESKTHLSGVEVRWNAYDQIKVANYLEGSTTIKNAYTFELTEGENTMDGTFYTGADYAEDFFDESTHNYVAIYPATSGNTITGATTADFTLPQEQSPQSWTNSFGDGAMAMMAVSSDRRLPFKNLLGGLCLQLTGLHEHVTALEITSNDPSEYLWGQFTASWSGGEPTLTHKSGGTGSNTVKLTGCGVTTSSDPTQTFYILLPPQTLKTGFTLTAYNGATKVYEHTATWASNPDVIKRSKCRRLDGDSGTSGAQGIDMAEGALPGLFSVSATKKVYFSKGNLQYQASTNTWRFAEHQWDYVGTQGGTTPGGALVTITDGGVAGGTISGSDNKNASSSYAGWIDLFAWGTSGYNYGATCYQPWSISKENSVYGPTYVESGTANNLSGNSDWGYNAISNGGNVEGLWHSLLTTTEWNYLLRERSGTPRFAKTQLNLDNGTAVKGLIVFPDGWTSTSWPSECPASTFTVGLDIYNADGGYVPTTLPNEGVAAESYNELTQTEWLYLEAKGVVFLPSAGACFGNDYFMGTGAFGRYWTATNSGAASGQNLRFNANVLDPTNASVRSTRYSVRLVREYVE